MVPLQPEIFWSVTIANSGDNQQHVECSQELLAFAAISEIDWGWLYGTPWNSGHYYDFFITERVRADVVAGDAREGSGLVRPGKRMIRLGVPRPVGIQRDEEAPGMLLEDTLPDHSAPDRDSAVRPAARATVHALTIRTADQSLNLVETDLRLFPETQISLAAVELPDESEILLDFTLDQDRATGILITHGNHPDSLQVGMSDGLLWVTAAGERLATSEPLAPSRYRASIQVVSGHVRLILDGGQALRTQPWWDSARWKAHWDGVYLTIGDTDTKTEARFCLETPADNIRMDTSRGIADWTVSLAPGQSTALKFSLRLAEAGSDARNEPGRFDDAFESIEKWWEDTWAAAFTRSNTVFSGYLPLLTADNDLECTYYTAALLAIYMRNATVSPLGPVYLSGGPRLGPSTTFFWNTGEWAQLLALLDPLALKAWIVAALGVPYEECFAFDTRNILPLGNHYAANDYSLFRSIEAYVGTTGDLSVLGLEIRGRTVLDHLKGMAFRVRDLRAAFGGRVLADFGGDPWELLECVPNYRHVVVSLNAGYVGMLDSYAALAARLGLGDEASRASEIADELAKAVLGQYAGDGRWKISFPDHDEAIGHCLDFQFAGTHLAGRLPDRVKGEMVEFAASTLLDGDWMRALAPDDPVAPLSDRPDHGAAGAYAAWPADTARALFALGYPDVAVDLLRRIHRTTSGGLWGQAMEARGDGSFFVAERGVSCRDMEAGAAAAEVILCGLFGIDAGFGSLDAPSGRLTTGGAEIANVRAIGFDLPMPDGESR